ncbi:MAG TPA: type II toxin-antitoxin system HigB family toxin [Agitococcus sp.]|uniref:type II toxin-antitoxin system HigB family toxin n=1 Tax=uncultured Agitococcus sp. TaxID=1506599 RepID=UPI00260AB05C|nr:type II toxin-antitoxin system HigB family toxin [uncultured Agitococcus sp.]HMU88913.1 type II toxin-antitoxin system HigB family toxin [Agitococcus sp.]HNA22195.1 type II toxin-antitoxin system HigB family toxin [Agitococcus sp.]HNC03909.1 type II toxin-antitoxin system HigB family toxin [Agitococcus sp.]HNH45347.1 type II toxin-antitoxin system HigB family toxin [Agitococcus sp.]HRH90718.1 type II toxin-antitoxin system HigB family toxin [Agitococcus sp.]
MRVIARRSLCQFWQKTGKEDAKTPLELWYHDAIKADWRTPHDIKQYAANASICGNNRVVFNIGGNKYRLVVEVQYQAAIVWVKFVGTHAEYDKINVETVNEY